MNPVENFSIEWKVVENSSLDEWKVTRGQLVCRFLRKIIPGESGIMYVVRGGNRLLAIPMRKLSARWGELASRRISVFSPLIHIVITSKRGWGRKMEGGPGQWKKESTTLSYRVVSKYLRYVFFGIFLNFSLSFFSLKKKKNIKISKYPEIRTDEDGWD